MDSISYLAPSSGLYEALAEVFWGDFDASRHIGSQGNIPSEAFSSALLVNPGRFQNYNPELTNKGLCLLQVLSSKELSMSTGISEAEETKVRIVAASQHRLSAQHDAFGFNSASDHVQDFELTIFGIIGSYPKQVPVARVRFSVVDAGLAGEVNVPRLSSIFQASPIAESLVNTLCNEDYDGAPVENYFELISMLNLEEAVGRNIILIDSLKVEPCFIGQGLGRSIIAQLLARYGKGDGVVVMPVKPVGVFPGSDAYSSFARKIAQTYLASGFQRHPYIGHVMVGNIATCRSALMRKAKSVFSTEVEGR